MQQVVNRIEALLPLGITSVSWEGEALTMGGNEWSFSTLGAWRLVGQDQVLVGCYDSESQGEAIKLQGLDITEVLVQSRFIGVDPVFMFSDGNLLEVFSTDTFEPWVFKLPDGTVFVA